MTYAINIAGMMELTRQPANLPLLLLLRGVVTEQVICPIHGKDWTHQALLVSGDVSHERWQAIVQLIRTRFRYDQFPLYEKTSGRWRTVR